MQTKTWKIGTFTIHDHTMELPWDHNNPSGPLGNLKVFARQIIPKGGENFPHLVFFQGGPGGACPKPINPNSGWLGRLLKEYRVVLLEQRGVGRSTRMDAHTITDLGDTQTQLQYAKLLRADQIVADAEAFRQEITGGKPWAAFGQSYGGFCITAYLSHYPEALNRVLYTGGTPALDMSADELYKITYGKVAKRHREYYKRFPEDEITIREICDHLENTEETLPTGERLTSRRLRMLGINLGRDGGYEALHYIFEAPFVMRGGKRRLDNGFIETIAPQLSYGSGPLYGLMHETIYAGATPALEGQPTNWAAHRMRAQVEGFAEDANPLDKNSPYYLTGEHIYPWQFQEDPALAPLEELANLLAKETDWPVLYRPEVLRGIDIPGAAAIYYDDIFVPLEPSLETAKTIGLEPYITNVYQHSGIGVDGDAILSKLLELSER
ncbi:alpha/beta hydrolase [Actinomycetaceae bacterium TAE3-ERU4]|nr:alpha/beta hydrolase [Actinomycetaceae bacterium TAE3-ERU4]